MKRITISRWSGLDKVSTERWEKAISALVLLGYSVYADEEKLVFTLGCDDSIEDVDDNR